MKKRFLFWASNQHSEQDQKRIVALALDESKNIVHRFVLTAADSNHEIFSLISSRWIDAEDITLPIESAIDTFPLTATTNLCPEGFICKQKTELDRTHTQWMFMVLSWKHFQNFDLELQELEEKLSKTEDFSSSMWAAMKKYWSTVQEQLKEEHLFYTHANQLKVRVNKAFELLKRLREQKNKEFEKESSDNAELLKQRLQEIESKIRDPKTQHRGLFNNLKTIQEDLKVAKLAHKTRNKLWSTIDTLFKELKKNQSVNPNELNRLNNRIKGLKDAIAKMEQSIGRDKNEEDRNNKKIDNSRTSQLESQLVVLKQKMVQDRIQSKSIKLADMQKTLSSLQRKADKMNQKMKSVAQEEE